MAQTQIQTQGIVDGAVTPAKLSTGGPSWDVAGNFGAYRATIGPYAGSTTFNASLAPPFRDASKENVVGLEIKNNGGNRRE